LFYPGLLLFKTQIVLLALAPLGLFLALRARPLPAALLLLLASGVVLFAAAIASGLALGVRHILPLYPVLAVLAAIALVRAPGRLAFKVVLIAILAFSGLRYHPYELAYLNEIAGGPEQGRRFFADSNLDWGQDLFDLRAAMEKLNVSYEAYLHSIFPAAQLGLLPNVRDKKIEGWVAVSISRAVGLWANMYPNDAALHAALDGRTPVGRVGYSVLLYYLPR
jgi:hypothetical protein